MPGMNSTINEDVNAMTWVTAFFAFGVGAAILISLSAKVSWLIIPGILCAVLAVLSVAMYVAHWLVKWKDIDIEKKYGNFCRILLCLPPKQRDPIAFYRANRSNYEVESEEISVRPPIKERTNYTEDNSMKCENVYM